MHEKLKKTDKFSINKSSYIYMTEYLHILQKKNINYKFFYNCIHLNEKYTRKIF